MESRGWKLSRDLCCDLEVEAKRPIQFAQIGCGKPRFSGETSSLSFLSPPPHWLRVLLWTELLRMLEIAWGSTAKVGP